MKKLIASLMVGATLVGAVATPRTAVASPNEAMAERAVAIMESAATLVERDKAACDKMGDDLSGFVSGKLDEIQKLKAWGMGLPAPERRALMEKYKPRVRAAVSTLRRDIEPCADNAKVRSVLVMVGLSG